MLALQLLKGMADIPVLDFLFVAAVFGFGWSIGNGLFQLVVWFGRSFVSIAPRPIVSAVDVQPAPARATVARAVRRDLPADPFR